MADGEKRLDKLVKGTHLLIKILAQYDENLYGQIAEIREMSKPQGNHIDFKQLGQKRAEGGQTIRGQNLNLGRHYLQEIYEEEEGKEGEEDEEEQARVQDE